MIKIDSKKKIVTEINNALKNAICVIVVDYRGLKSFQMMEMRRLSRGLNVKFIVVRNTLAKIALKGTGFVSLIDILTGPVLFVFSYEDHVKIGGLLNNFSNDIVKLNVKGFSFAFCEKSIGGLDELVLIPSYRDSILKLIFILNGFQIRLMNVMLAPYVNFLNLLNIICDLKKNNLC